MIRRYGLALPGDYAKYLDAASKLDRKIGKIIELLKKDGLFDNTLMCFMGGQWGSACAGQAILLRGGTQRAVYFELARRLPR